MPLRLCGGYGTFSSSFFGVCSDNVKFAGILPDFTGIVKPEMHYGLALKSPNPEGFFQKKTFPCQTSVLQRAILHEIVRNNFHNHSAGALCACTEPGIGAN
jgi:hypothetical protein